MIEVNSLTKTFQLSRQQRKELNTREKALTVVKSVSFSCQPGRVFSLLGPNGAGKTTVLRMIATILKPSGGSIVVAGKDSVREPNSVRKKIGFLTGSTGLYPRMTPNEVVRYFAELHGVEKEIFKARKERLYNLLGMHDFANKRIGKLSTGMKQKVSIVRTMIHDPEVVVFDEPTSGLDVITAKNIIELIRDCAKDNKTVIFSSHIMSEVDLLADDLAIIHKGQLLFNGTMADFKANMQTEGLTEEFIRIVNEAN